MSFSSIIKSVLTKISSYFERISDTLFTNKSSAISYDGVKIYHHNNFSHIFINTQLYNLLSDTEFLLLLDYITQSIKLSINVNDSPLINIITKVIFKDKLGIIYTHSLTYKSLFTLDSLNDWPKLLNKDIKDLLEHYNDSTLQNIEFRFDYIKNIN